MQLIKSLNWIDLVVIVILIRIVFIGVQSGFVIEFFKFLGAIFSLFVCLHYFSVLSGLLAKYTSIPLDILVSATFLLIWVFMFLLCKIIRDGLMMVFTIEAQSFVDKWGGALVGIGRFFIIASMVMFLFLLTGSNYLETMTVQSASQKYIVPVAPRIYRTIHEGLVAKLFSGERYNQEVSRQLRKIEKP